MEITGMLIKNGKFCNFFLQPENIRNSKYKTLRILHPKGFAFPDYGSLGVSDRTFHPNRSVMAQAI
jgi:hypothetical protein